MKKLKEKLKYWLFADEIQRLNKLTEKIEGLESIHTKINDCYKSIDRMYNLLHSAKTDCKSAQDELIECKKLFNQICDVGVDVGYHSQDHSWAVVCIAGRPEYVKFIPLNYDTAKDVLRFLKQFEYSNKVIDSPIAFKYMVKDYLFNREH